MTSGSRQEASCPETGLHRRRLYDLRHTFASLMLTLGAPIAFVSEQTGHANIQLTVKLYGHLEPRANRHWLNRLRGSKNLEQLESRLQVNASQAQK